MIAELRFYGSSLPPLLLAEGRRTFTIGAGDCDLVVPPEVAIGVAQVHAIVERVEVGIRVREHGSGHGLYRSPRSPRVDELLLHAGAVGWVGSCPLLALDHGLAALRPRLAWSMGLDAHAAVDEAITPVGEGAPIAIVGPHNLDAVALTQGIHDAGAARDREILICADSMVPPFGAFDGTVVVDLDRVRRLPSSQVVAIFAPRCPARVIFLASDERVLRHRLDVYTERVRTFALVPLARRGEEIARLLQTIWRHQLGSNRSVDALGPIALRGMGMHRWRGNFDELRAMAVRLLAYVEHPSLRRAARALGVRHQTLGQHLTRIGVPILDQSDRDLALISSMSDRTRSLVGVRK